MKLFTHPEIAQIRKGIVSDVERSQGLYVKNCMCRVEQIALCALKQ